MQKIFGDVSQIFGKMRKSKISGKQFLLDCINKEFELIGSPEHFNTFEDLVSYAEGLIRTPTTAPTTMHSSSSRIVRFTDWLTSSAVAVTSTSRQQPSIWKAEK